MLHVQAFEPRQPSNQILSTAQLSLTTERKFVPVVIPFVSTTKYSGSTHFKQPRFIFLVSF
eukprot:m.257286 g.257286  ORF g.257286 m.257286 type:complete len:61 (+) comp15526_c0_seq2:1603-1785(+)